MALIGTLGHVASDIPNLTNPHPRCSQTPNNEFYSSCDGYPPIDHPRGQYSNNVYNSGGNSNGSGYQKNGDIKVRNQSPTSGLINIGSIASNKGNEGVQQLLGDVKVANIGC